MKASTTALLQRITLVAVKKLSILERFYQPLRDARVSLRQAAPAKKRLRELFVPGVSTDSFKSMQAPLTRAMLSRNEDLLEAVYDAYEKVCRESSSDSWTRRQVRMQNILFNCGINVECRHIPSLVNDTRSSGQRLRHQTPRTYGTTSQVLEQIPEGASVGEERKNRLFLAACGGAALDTGISPIMLFATLEVGQSTTVALFLQCTHHTVIPSPDKRGCFVLCPRANISNLKTLSASYIDLNEKREH